MELKHVADGRDDCGVLIERSHNADERRMGPDTDCVLQTIVHAEGLCIFCSVTSYSISSRGSKSEHHSCAYMSCKSCDSKFCSNCINELVDSIDGCEEIPQTVKQYDTTYKKINEIRMKMSLGLRITDFGPCCLFRVIDTTSTLVKTPRPDPTVRCNRIQSIKNYRQCIGTIKKKKNRLQLNVSNDNNVLGIEQYFLNPIKTSHLGIFHKKQNPKLLHKWIAYKQRRRFGTQKNSTYNPFLGALVLPTFGLLIEAEVTNSHWYCDHHCLAKSQADGTLGVPHCVLSNDCAASLHSSNLSLPRITGSSRKRYNLDISAPEDIQAKRQITVEVIEVDQKIATSDVILMKGDNSFDGDFMRQMSFFSSEDTLPDVDVTIILGIFTIDMNIHPKMLLLRFSGMLANVNYSYKRKKRNCKRTLPSTSTYCWSTRIRGSETRWFIWKDMSSIRSRPT